MAEQAELAFIKNFINTIGAAPVVYGDDYQQPPSNSLKRIPVLPVDLPPPPERKQPEASTLSASIKITFKSIKPPKSYTLSVQPTDPISDIKSQLASSPGAPPPDTQRLLLKGKALADSKLLKEYNIKDGDTITLMVKPGYDWDPSKVISVTPPTPATEIDRSDMTSTSQPGSSRTRTGHVRVPSVVLSPSPSGSSPGEEKPTDILLTLDTSIIPTASLSAENSASPFHDTISDPEFWVRLLTFLRGEFGTNNDAVTAWEDFLRVSKGTLSPNEIARIRDHVGIVGMGGT
ncbi:hypothetical protein JAAARDRAFT_42163 [Jaapia argillacea MUCL 33604]|uniref:Ubiquitin-like domain-containing protein n=1 Tax=Jaapia argillacea MUCL 33604 TaxID=933084 RepID=A0A067P6G6_9AGAM|nr:hypothetical protein JAAARDRAFT_42163 [Jaapia argillacea MUCL 33604]